MQSLEGNTNNCKPCKDQLYDGEAFLGKFSVIEIKRVSIANRVTVEINLVYPCKRKYKCLARTEHV